MANTVIINTPPLMEIFRFGLRSFETAWQFIRYKTSKLAKMLPEYEEEVSEDSVQVVLVPELRLRRNWHQQQWATLHVSASRQRGDPSLQHSHNVGCLHPLLGNKKQRFIRLNFHVSCRPTPPFCGKPWANFSLNLDPVVVRHELALSYCRSWWWGCNMFDEALAQWQLAECSTWTTLGLNPSIYGKKSAYIRQRCETARTNKHPYFFLTWNIASQYSHKIIY